MKDSVKILLSILGLSAALAGTALTVNPLFQRKVNFPTVEAAVEDIDYGAGLVDLESLPRIELGQKKALIPEELILSRIHSARQNDFGQDKYDYSHPIIHHFPNQNRKNSRI